jgi:two-component system, chemotaxis family, CheB/CheR fusion protein
VLRTLQGESREVRSREGRWYAVHLLPYRAKGNVIAGVLLTFTDISQLKKTEIEMREAREFAESILDTLREPLLILDGELRVISANPAFYTHFRTTAEQTRGQPLLALGSGQWDIPELRRLLQEIIPNNNSFNDFRVTHPFPSLGRRTMLLNARRIDREDKKQPKLILLAFQDVTGNEETP